jgi:hypothetical protein
MFGQYQFEVVHIMFWFVYEISYNKYDTYFFNGILVVISYLHYKVP